MSAIGNILYWIDEIDIVLKNVYNILDNNGKFIVLVPNQNYKTNLINFNNSNKIKWREMLDMNNRVEVVKHAYNLQKWREIFSKNGFEDSYYKEYMPSNFIKMSEIGLRPISNFLIEIISQLTDKKRIEIKTKWVNYFYELIISLFEDNQFNLNSQPTFIIFELIKRKK